MSLRSSIARALKAVRKALKRIARRAVGTIVGAALFIPRLVLAALLPVPKDKKAEETTTAPSPPHGAVPEEPDEADELDEPDETPGGVDEAPGLRTDLGAEPEEPKQLPLSRFQQIKNTAADLKDDLLARMGLAEKSLTEQTPTGLGVNEAAADSLKQGTSPIQKKLDATANSNAPQDAAAQKKTNAQTLKS